jgi:hypothetical protein
LATGVEHAVEATDLENKDWKTKRKWRVGTEEKCQV